MRITIDTQQDSHAEIRKAIRLLQQLVGESHVYSNEPAQPRNIFDSPSPSVDAMDSAPEPAPAPTNAFADMFSSAPAEPSGEELSSQQLLDEQTEKEDDDLVEFY